MASPTRLQAMNDIDDRVDQKRKELINIANFISDQGLKIKQASTHDKVLDYFRGKKYSFNRHNRGQLPPDSA